MAGECMTIQHTGLPQGSLKEEEQFDKLQYQQDVIDSNCSSVDRCACWEGPSIKGIWDLKLRGLGSVCVLQELVPWLVVLQGAAWVLM